MNLSFKLAKDSDFIAQTLKEILKPLEVKNIVIENNTKNIFNIIFSLENGAKKTYEISKKDLSLNSILVLIADFNKFFSSQYIFSKKYMQANILI
ncbi:hypothetical protein IP364_03980 [Helicobacter winghamensis]|uniref:hypothetical protein n=1 Tax=Helicobacter winghamensis TaxID=157268 RepID=UPI00279D6846